MPLSPKVALVATMLLLGATACTDDEAPAGEEELGTALAALASDPAAAREFLTGGEPDGTAEAIEAADVPADGRVAWLVAGRDHQSHEVVEDLGATLVAATGEDIAGADDRARADRVLDEAMRAAGDPGGDPDSLDPRLRVDLARAAAGSADRVFDELAPAAARQADWELDPRREFLVEVGQDARGRRALLDALVTEAGGRLGPTPEGRLEAVNERVGAPLGRMVGALDAGGDPDAFADDQEMLVRMFTDWARENTDDQELATNLANDVGAAFQEQFD